MDIKYVAYSESHLHFLLSSEGSRKDFVTRLSKKDIIN